MQHSGHDYERLAARWVAVAESRGWRVTEWFRDGEFPVLAVENEASSLRKPGGTYISAGVHGDECAPPWALIDWAEKVELPDETPLLVFPCLNPYGFVENLRRNREGIDLNRHFQDAGIPVIRAWQEFLEGRRFDCAIHLHEDFDARGIYLYELARSESRGEEFLEACEEIIPRETAESVDGSDFENGLLRRSIDEETLRRVVEEDLGGGWPEAIWLWLHHARDTFTFETPSEFALGDRIAAQRRYLETIA